MVYIHTCHFLSNVYCCINPGVHFDHLHTKRISLKVTPITRLLCIVECSSSVTSVTAYPNLNHILSILHLCFVYWIFGFRDYLHWYILILMQSVPSFFKNFVCPCNLCLHYFKMLQYGEGVVLLHFQLCQLPLELHPRMS